MDVYKKNNHDQEQKELPLKKIYTPPVLIELSHMQQVIRGGDPHIPTENNGASLGAKCNCKSL